MTAYCLVVAQNFKEGWPGPHDDGSGVGVINQSTYAWGVENLPLFDSSDKDMVDAYVHTSSFVGGDLYFSICRPTRISSWAVKARSGHFQAIATKHKHNAEGWQQKEHGRKLLTFCSSTLCSRHNLVTDSHMHPMPLPLPRTRLFAFASPFPAPSGSDCDNSQVATWFVVF
jgi:hypothetical protein